MTSDPWESSEEEGGLFEANSVGGSLNLSTGREDSPSGLELGNDDPDIDALVGSEDTSLDLSENTKQVPTKEQIDLETCVNIGKALLSQYSDPVEDEHDPQQEPLRYLWNDAPELLLVGALAGYAAASAVGNSSSTTEPKTQQPVQLPQDRTYRVFVSHSWKHSDHQERVREFLNEEESLEWHDLSVPEHDPLDIEAPGQLRPQLRKQIERSSVVLVLSGMYVSYSETIQMEIEIAKEMGKPIIGIKPWGNEQIPVHVKEHADTIVGWNMRSIVNAIAEHA